MDEGCEVCFPFPPPSRLTKHAPCGFVVIYRARDLRDENLS